MLFTGFSFIFALVLLIVVHESGHFLVARWCGVKVLRFSLGFGKILASWRDKHGTEYALSLLPLGGYVKMLDEEEGAVAAKERHLAFNHQTLLVRTAIVLGGPLFNFLLAFLLLWCVWVLGVKSLAPMIDGVYPNSVADKAGLTAQQEIKSFDGHRIASWRDFQYALMPLIGSEKRVALTVQSLIDKKESTVYLSLNQWRMDPNNPDALKSLGIIPFVPKIPAIVGGVIAGSPAALAGLQIGDEIIAIDNEAIKDWLALLHFVKAHPNESQTIEFKRHGQSIKQVIRIGSQVDHGKVAGFLGLSSRPVDLPPDWLRLQRSGPIQALYLALGQTVELTKGTFTLIGRMLSGHLSMQSISGPVGIAEGAGESARNGVVYYLSFIALLSISLGVLNLLPIPMLDGGHLFFYLIEAIMRRPVSMVTRTKSAYVGFTLLLALTVIALTNDLSRF